MIDLHTHTVHSDGILTVNELVNNAIENNVQIISITDHDTISGLIEYQNMPLKKDILVIPGVEFSTDTYYLGRKTKIHLLGYGYKIKDKRINQVLQKLYIRRFNDNKEYLEDLIKKFSFLNAEYFHNFNYTKYGWLYKNILNHIRTFINEEQLELLKEYLLSNKPIYNKYNESVEDMIKLIHSCHGYSVFAHPQKCDITKKELQTLVMYLRDLGLDGLAIKYDLYETGGSDFHSFKYASGVGDPNIKFPQDYEPLLVKKLIKEKKVLGDISEQ